MRSIHYKNWFKSRSEEERIATPCSSKILPANFFVLLISWLVVFSSCQKVIDVDIENVPKKYVVEGIVTDQQDSSRVLISTTKDMSESGGFEGDPGK